MLSINAGFVLLHICNLDLMFFLPPDLYKSDILLWNTLVLYFRSCLFKQPQRPQCMQTNKTVVANNINFNALVWEHIMLQLFFSIVKSVTALCSKIKTNLWFCGLVDRLINNRLFAHKSLLNVSVLPFFEYTSVLKDVIFRILPSKWSSFEN